MKVWFPALLMKAVYDIRGQLLMMPINGRGQCWGNFSDIDSILSMKLNRIKINGQEHYKVDFLLAVSNSSEFSTS